MPAFVLAILLVYTLARFYGISYIGFKINPSSGEIVDTYTSSEQLVLGDEIVSVNGQPMSEDQAPHKASSLAVAEHGSMLNLIVRDQNGAQRQVDWAVPGFNSTEFFSRLVNTWIVGYFFWVAGTATLLFTRPRDKNWALLVAFNYITAIWFIAGGVSYSGVYESQAVLRMAIWLATPIYLHLHWVFPRPLARLPNGTWRTLYVLAAVGAVATWFGLLPWSLYVLVFGIAVLGSLFMLGFRYFFRGEERAQVGFLFFAAAVALAPAAAVALSSEQSDISVTFAGYVLSLIALPGAYFYVIYRRRLGGLELRANRLISLYLFLVLLLTITLLTFPLIFAFFPSLQQAGGAIIIATLATSIVSVYGFERFQLFVERRLLRIPRPPQHVLEGFASRISTSFTREGLAETLSNEVLPSLLVRESALVDFEGKNAGSRLVFNRGLDVKQLPSDRELQTLAAGGTHLVEPGDAPDWVRVSIPIMVGGTVRGVWLLGRKDPDDYYSQPELNLLKSLADQTAIALVNLSQAENLRALHQADIERQETERVHLARELHDDTLRRITELSRMVDDALYSEEYGAKSEALVSQVRTLMNGLRPPLLEQGLFIALLTLADDLATKTKMHIEVDIPQTTARLDPNLEQHIFRIVQQACENALRHSKGKKLSIKGSIDPERVAFSIEDDGDGFELNSHSGLAHLLATRHFGLAGMNERAAMVGASLDIQSSPGKGTRVSLEWEPDS